MAAGGIRRCKSTPSSMVWRLRSRVAFGGTWPAPVEAVVLGRPAICRQCSCDLLAVMRGAPFERLSVVAVQVKLSPSAALARRCGF